MSRKNIGALLGEELFERIFALLLGAQRLVRRTDVLRRGVTPCKVTTCKVTPPPALRRGGRTALPALPAVPPAPSAAASPVV